MSTCLKQAGRGQDEGQEQVPGFSSASQGCSLGL